MKSFLFYFSFIAFAFVLSLVMSVNHSTLNAQAENQVYKIATDTTYAPFVFEDTDGYEGIDMSILEAIARDQGFEYNLNPIGFNAALQGLEARQVDGVIAGMGITEERQEVFDFSDSYFEAGTVFGVDAGSDISSLEDLDGEVVAVKTGTTGAALANELSDEYGFTTREFEDSVNMYNDVMAGNSAAAVEDTPVMYYAINTGQVDFEVITDDMDQVSMGFAVHKGENAELLEMFNQGLANIRESGEYDEIIEEYLGESAIEDQQAATGVIGQFTQNADRLFSGLWTTILVTLISIVIALIFGIILGLMRTSDNKILDLLALFYIDIMRGIPMIVLAFFVYFGIPQLLNTNLSAFQAGIITLSVNAAAYIGEIIRGGINAVDVGQKEASRSLGMPQGKTMRYVILPQAVKIMIPSLINQFIMTLKDSSILSVIGLVELTQTGRIIIARTYQSGTMWLIVGAMYVIVITILAKLSNYLERKWIR